MNFRMIVTIIICSYLLQGCVGAALVAGATAVSTATDPRSVGTQVDDTTLKLRVSNALNQDQQLKSNARIENTIYKGQVLLTGQAPTTDLIAKAQQLVMSVNGVHGVYNEIRLGKPISFSTISNDTWLTTKVRSQFLTSDLVKSSNIKVTTENGEVFLLGIVTHKQGDAAAEIASKVSGVKRVIKAFTYID